MSGEPLPCLHCTKLFQPKGRGRKPKFCSGACRSAYGRRRARPQPDEFATAVTTVLRDSPRPARAIARELGALADEIADNDCVVTSPTMTNWAHGESRPRPTEHTLRRLGAFERAAGADPGALVGAFHRTVAAGQPSVWQPSTRPPARSGPAAARSGLEAAGITNRCRCTVVSAVDEHLIGLDRKPAHSAHRVEICAVVPDLDRVWTVFTADDRSPIELAGTENCRPGRQEIVEAVGYCLHAVELLLEEPLGVGDVGRYGIVLDNPPHPEINGIPQPGCMRVVEDLSYRRLAMRIRFAGDQPPKNVWRGSWRPDSFGAPAVQEVVSAVDGWYELTLTDPPPGSHGLHWEWYGAMDALPVPGAPR